MAAAASTTAPAVDAKAPSTYHTVVLAKRANGLPTTDQFQVKELPMLTPADVKDGGMLSRFVIGSFGCVRAALYSILWCAVVLRPIYAEVLVRVLYLSVDPYMRGRIGSDAKKSSSKPLDIGAVIVGATVGQVMHSKHASIPAGAIVHAYSGSQCLHA
jgi:NADPH-dependent curcumin reductase CurA